MTTYTFLKALELLISKMGRSTAEKISHGEIPQKLPFCHEKYVPFRQQFVIDVVKF
jgi:hypothetical protein